jgi:hypothetical protein
MQLSLDLITEFQKLHLKTFGEQIMPEAAELELLSLAELLRIVQPLKNKENENEK